MGKFSFEVADSLDIIIRISPTIQDEAIREIPRLMPLIDEAAARMDSLRELPYTRYFEQFFMPEEYLPLSPGFDPMQAIGGFKVMMGHRLALEESELCELNKRLASVIEALEELVPFANWLCMPKSGREGHLLLPRYPASYYVVDVRRKLLSQKHLIVLTLLLG